MVNVKGDYMKTVLPAGRYFIGDVSGYDKPLFSVTVDAAVYYDTELKYELMVGDYDIEGETGLFGIIPWADAVECFGVDAYDFEFYGAEFSDSFECSYDGFTLRFGEITFL